MARWRDGAMLVMVYWGSGMKENRSTVIAIGDDQSHLAALASGLGRKGVTCRPICYEGDASVVPRCPDVRVILADFCLGADALSSDGSTGFGADFSTIGHLLEDRIRPAGPYRIVLWTRYVREAQALAAFLEGLRTVPRPEVVRALDKALHLDAGGNVMDEDALMRELEAVAGGWFRRGGALALAGAWGDIDDQEVDALVEEIYESRRRDVGRRLEQ